MLALDSLLYLIAPHQRTNAIQTYNAIMSGHDKPGINTYRNIDNEGNEFVVLTVDHVVDWQGEPAMQTTVVDLSNHVDTLKKTSSQRKTIPGTCRWLDTRDPCPSQLQTIVLQSGLRTDSRL